MHDDTTISRVSRRAVALTAAVAVAASLAVAAAVGAPVRANAATTEPEAADFASDVYGDAWDFSNAADFNTDFSGTPATVTGGALKADLALGNAITLVHTISGSLATGRDGARQPVDPAKYSRLTFSMNQPLDKRIGAVYWFTCREQTSACGGGFTFSTVPGSHVYDFDLNAQSNLLGKVPWRSGKKVVFRFDPVVLPGGTRDMGQQISIDWVRLHAAPDATHPHASMPPGNYGGYTVTPRPQVVVDSPNQSQGQDYATVTNGRPWNFTSAAATSRVSYSNATLLARDSRGITARNAAPRQNDPQVHLPVSRVAGNTYHYLQFDMQYDGPFSLSGSPGGGKMARAIWNVSGTVTPQISNDILTYSSGNAAETTVDLTAQNPLDEDALAPKAGWAGQTITGLRFDPNEDPGQAVWHLKSVHLRADPTATGSTTVTFHDAAWVQGATADVAVRIGSGSWQRIATGVAVAKGSNAVPFSLGSKPAGKYGVRVTVRHPDGSATAADASAPIVMKAGAPAAPDRSHDPRGTLDSAVAVSGGATLSGWAYDPDTRDPIAVALYDTTSGAKSLGRVTTSVARPDVVRAHPDAPRTSGYEKTVSLTKGTHSICAYGINVGTGTANTKLGCRSVTVR